MGKDKLTPKQKRFVKAYCGVSKGNGTDAAVRAGYAKGSARISAARLLTYDNIQEAIKNQGGTSADIASPEEIQEFWTRIVRDEEQDFDREGARPVATRDRIKAAELLGKCSGLFIERKEISGPDGGPIEHQHNVDYSELTEEQLKKMASKK